MESNIKKLIIHESLPFAVTYFEDDGESYCKVKQDDLEEYIRETKRALKVVSRMFYVLGVVCAISIATTAYLVANPITEYVIVGPEKESN